MPEILADAALYFDPESEEEIIKQMEKGVGGENYMKVFSIINRRIDKLIPATEVINAVLSPSSNPGMLA